MLPPATTAMKKLPGRLPSLTSSIVSTGPADPTGVAAKATGATVASTCARPPWPVRVAAKVDPLTWACSSAA